MQRVLPIVALAATYFVFAILLNSVGVVILQSIETFDVSKSQASVLEGYKDLSIAIVSFFVASILPRVGYKLALLGGLLLVALATALTASIPSFVMIKLLFAAIGVGFALVKVAVYSLIGELTSDQKQHSALMNTIEGVFMLGTLFGYWLFSLFVSDDPTNGYDWLNVYWLLSMLIAIIFGLVIVAQVSEGSVKQKSGSNAEAFLAMLKLAYQPLVLIFVISIFLYVLVEQGIGTWLPTFNREILGLSLELSVQMTSLFAAGLAFGRLAAGQVLKTVHWFHLVVGCLLAMAVLILIVMPLASGSEQTSVTTWSDAPLAAFILPMIGFFMAPIYPAINSVMLSSLEKQQHAPMTGLIVVFSALGGTTGSIITGNVFQYFGGQQAFYTTLVPIIALLGCLYLFNQRTLALSKEKAHG